MTNIKLHLQDGTVHETKITDFDLDTFIDEVNENQHKMMKFGEIGIIAHNIRMVDASGKEVLVNE